MKTNTVKKLDCGQDKDHEMYENEIVEQAEERRSKSKLVKELNDIFSWLSVSEQIKLIDMFYPNSKLEDKLFFENESVEFLQKINNKWSSHMKSLIKMRYCDIELCKMKDIKYKLGKLTEEMNIIKTENAQLKTENAQIKNILSALTED